jgi:anaerobic ribonucleoside-triphosphate reductase activating protein
MTNLLYDHIEAKSLVDGPGSRTVLFLKGCNIGCPGCQNAHLWDTFGAHVEDTLTMAKTLKDLASGSGLITISGGEPFLQIDGLKSLLVALRILKIKHVIIYTGFTWEDLFSGLIGNVFKIIELLQFVDILVDGPFKRDLDHDKINWRGSSNQRPINVQETLKNYRLDRPGGIVLEDWDSPRIQIDTDGSAVMPVGLANELIDLGNVAQNRMCGQTTIIAK